MVWAYHVQLSRKDLIHGKWFSIWVTTDAAKACEILRGWEEIWDARPDTLPREYRIIYRKTDPDEITTEETK